MTARASAWGQMDRWAVCVLALLSVLSLGPWLGQHVLFSDDFMNQSVPAWHWVQQQLRLGREPLWCGQMLMGHPLSDEGQIANFYLPVQWLLAVFSAWKMQAVFDALHCAVLAWGTYCLARKAKLTSETAFFAGLAATAAGPVWECMRFNDLAGLAWAPWATLGLLKALTEKGRGGFDGALIAGLALGLAGVGGHPALALYSACSSLVLALLWARTARQEEDAEQPLLSSRLGRALMAAALMAAVAGPQVLARIRYQPLSVRNEAFSNDVASVSNINLGSYLQVAHPLLLGHFSNATFLGRSWRGGSPNPQGMWLSIGSILLVLAALAVARRDKRALALAGIALFWGLYALGSTTPLHDWVHALPLFRHLRAPMKAHSQWAWLLPLCAAFGLEQLRTRWSSLPARSLIVFGLLGLVAALGLQFGAPKLIDFTQRQVALRPPGSLALSAEAYVLRCVNWIYMVKWHLAATAAIGFVGAVLFTGLRRYPRACIFSLALLVHAEHLSWAWQVETPGDESFYTKPPHLLEKITAAGGGRYFSLGYKDLLLKAFPNGRFYADFVAERRVREHVGDSSGLLFGTESAHGYVPAGLERTWAWQGDFIDYTAAPTDFGVFRRQRGLLDKGAVRWFAPAHPLDEPGLISHGRVEDLWLYENAHAEPLARFSAGWQVRETWQKALDAARIAGAPDQLESPVEAEVKSPRDELELLSREDQHWRLRYRAGGARLLVLASSWYPGPWKAELEGKALTLVPVNGAFTALRVPAGSGMIDFIYLDPSYAWGRRWEWALTILVLGALSFSWWSEQRKT